MTAFELPLLSPMEMPCLPGWQGSRMHCLYRDWCLEHLPQAASPNPAISTMSRPHRQLEQVKLSVMVCLSSRVLVAPRQVLYDAVGCPRQRV